MDWNAWNTTWGVLGLWIALLAVIVAAFAAVTRGRNRRGRRDERDARRPLRPHSSELTAQLELLDERYARGEISTDEYTRRRRELVEGFRDIA